MPEATGIIFSCDYCCVSGYRRLLSVVTTMKPPDLSPTQSDPCAVIHSLSVGFPASFVYLLSSSQRSGYPLFVFFANFSLSRCTFILPLASSPALPQRCTMTAAGEMVAVKARQRRQMMSNETRKTREEKKCHPKYSAQPRESNRSRKKKTNWLDKGRQGSASKAASPTIVMRIQHDVDDGRKVTCYFSLVMPLLREAAAL